MSARDPRKQVALAPLIVFVTGLVLGAGLLLMWRQDKIQTREQHPQTAHGLFPEPAWNALSRREFTSDGNTYVLYTYSEKLRPTDHTITQVVQEAHDVDQGPGAEFEVLVIPSVREAIPEKRPLLPFANIGEEQTILETVLFETDSTATKLYTLDAEKRQLRGMQINHLISESTELSALSPSQSKIIAVPFSENNDQTTMYVVDLLQDNYRLLLELPESETFRAGDHGLSPSFDIEWLSENKIRYAVYGKTEFEIDPESRYLKKPLEYRELEIN